MSWMHVVAALLLVTGSVALITFLKWVETLDPAEPADLAPASGPVRWPPPPAVVAAPPPRARPTAVDSAPYRHAA